MNDKQRARVVSVLKQSREMIEKFGPAPGHPGPCTPESGCDGLCMDAAYAGDLVRRIDDELKELER